MTTPAERLHLQPPERHLTQRAGAITVGCFPAYRDQFLAYYSIISEVRVANRKRRHSVREL